VIHHPEESPAIAKRKPPSQRPERKLDDTAKAIARARDEAKAEKAAESESSARPASDVTKPHLARLAKGLAPTKPGGPPPAPSTKRPKMGGGG
jgi:hypothetical protein